MSIADQLTYLSETKGLIKTALNNKGLTITDELPFRQYATKINEAGSMIWSEDVYQQYLAYTRPSDWLTWTPLTVSDEKVLVLVAVYGNSNNLKFSVTCSGGGYKVNWNAQYGSTYSSYASGTTIGYTYDYMSAELSGATISSRGYKMALISIEPSGNAHITGINFDYKHSQTDLAAYGVGYLEMDISLPYATSINFTQTPAVNFNVLERISLRNHNLSSFANLFKNCMALENVNKLYIPASITNFSFMYQNCANLRTIQNIDFTGKYAVNIQYMLSGCSSLITIPLLDTSQVTNFDSFLSGCASLTIMPDLSYANASNCMSLFNGCTSLKDLPKLNFPVCTNFSSTFLSCPRLVEITFESITTSGTNCSSMFYGSSSLKRIYGLSGVNGVGALKVTSASAMFCNCTSMVYFPYLDLSACTACDLMFGYCNSMYTIPAYNTGNCTDFSHMFFACPILKTAPALDLTKATTTTLMFSSCGALASLPSSGYNTPALQYATQMFTSCSGLTTVPLFDTSKVTDASQMFFNCSRLTAIPSFNWTSLQSASQFAQGCTVLTTIGDLFFTKLTAAVNGGTSNMFYGCTALTTIGSITISGASNYITYSMFYNCSNITTAGNVTLWCNSASSCDVGQMFYGCTKLPSITTSFLKGVFNTQYMFLGCSTATSLPTYVSDTSNLTASYMYQGCSALTSLPVSSIGNSTTWQYTFLGCSNITGNVTLTGINTGSLTLSGLFYSCTKINTITINLAGSWVNISSMFYGCAALTTIRRAIIDQGNPNFYTLSSIELSGASTSSMSSTIFQNCYALAYPYIKNVKYSFSLANTAVSGAMMKNIALNLYNYGSNPSQIMTWTSTPAASGTDGTPIADIKAAITNKYWISVPA